MYGGAISTGCFGPMPMIRADKGSGTCSSVSLVLRCAPPQTARPATSIATLRCETVSVAATASTATDCAVAPFSQACRPPLFYLRSTGSSASASLPSTSIRRPVPVRVDRHLPLDRFPALTPLGRPRPVRPSVHPQRRSLPLFQGAQGLPSTALQSPPPPHCQTASPATLRFASRPWSLGDSETGIRIKVSDDALGITRSTVPPQRLPATKANQGDHARASVLMPASSPARAMITRK